MPTVIEKVRTFDGFDLGNDSHLEHDFGAFQIGDQLFYFKVDYYDLDLRGGSPDPADENVTRRVMVIMLAEEY
jgi:hypothetical protein